MIAGICGLLFAVFAILFARRVHGEHWLYAITLVALPGIYSFFAFYAGEATVGFDELIFGIPFIAGGLLLVLSSTPQTLMVIGALWILHALYDLTHEWFFINPAAPGWYPMFCASVDFVIGLYVLRLAIKAKK